MIITSLTPEKIIQVGQALPPAPRIMAGLHKMLLDSKSGLSEIAQLLKRDVSLTTRIIRIANSPAYNGGGLGSIEEAVQRVGFGEIFRLVGVAANAALADQVLKCYGYTSEKFLQHNLCNALMAEGIARRTKKDTRLAYTAGLLRCIGQLLLDRIGRDQLGSADMFPEARGMKVLDWEMQTFGLNHFQVSRILLREWDFPQDVISAVCHYAGSGEQPTPLTPVLDLSEFMVNFAGYGLQGEETTWGIPSEQLEANRLDIQDTEAISRDALATLKTLQSA